MFEPSPSGRGQGEGVADSGAVGTTLSTCTLTPTLSRRERGKRR
jgi:hypothetical protein